MTWYVLEVEDAMGSQMLLRGQRHRLLVNEKWEVKREVRETMDIINAAMEKYPNGRSRFTSRYFSGFRPAILSTLDRVAMRAVLGHVEARATDLSVDVVAEIII